jgi:protein-L-isoaspartate(D-aspartate) O-methyltransferase
MQDKIDEAFSKYRREDFLPKEVKLQATFDAPLPIGHNQTNSQPSTVRRMLVWLDVQDGQKVLDVGSGSGWTTALLSHLAGSEGRVYAVEKVPELVRFGEENCQKQGVANAEFRAAGDSFGLPDNAPFDRILVSASANEMPQELIDQLGNGGRMVIPVRHSIFVVNKDNQGTIKTTEQPGYAFVPLV